MGSICRKVFEVVEVFDMVKVFEVEVKCSGVEGGFCLLEVLRCWRCGGDTLRDTLYAAGGHGG